jgi:3-hydroxyisobutyrate dehydrogenase-like beta-hydroxyacid dehydrogenase
MSAVAFLGLGNMGAPMAASLLATGHEVVVWNRTVAVAEAFAAQHGGRVAGSAAEAVVGAEVVISMLADDAALLDTYLGEGGVLDALPSGALAVDMSTISPTTVATLHDRLDERGIALVDAPVSGSVAAATAATLTIMAAGEPEAVERARPVLSDLGSPVIAIGPSGAGSSMKLAVNAVLHSLNGAVSEALVLAEKAGIARADAYGVFLESAIAAPFVTYRQQSFADPDGSPVAFALGLAAKDLRLAIELAESCGARLPQATANLAVLADAMTAGYVDRDETALAEYLRDPVTD